ncbi:MAG: CPBP family intramembrane glutamic endopeptidase [Steroidobacteraceae bacterium]
MILGVALPLVALAATVRLPVPTAPDPRRPGDAATMAGLLGWIVLFLAVKGPLQAALLPSGAGAAATLTVSTALKLAAFVAVPALVLRWRGLGRWQGGRPTAPAGRLALCFVVMAVAGFGVQALMGSQLRVYLEAGRSGPEVVAGLVACFAWMSLEAGLVEEFFFRWYLQSRLAAWSGSQLTAIFIGSLVFGLAHAPGIWLRGAGGVEGLGDAPSLLTSVAYVIAVQGVAGLTFAVLWARTRSFALVVLLHGAFDAPSNAAQFVAAWGG